MIKKILFATMLAASLVSAVPTVAAADVYVRVAPPALRTEVMPAPRHGHTWTPGYWNWRGNKHVWVNGSWKRDRPGYRYAAPAWQERDGRWTMQRGRWSRGDRDGDGVPNVVDRQPNNPLRH